MSYKVIGEGIYNGQPTNRDSKGVEMTQVKPRTSDPVPAEVFKPKAAVSGGLSDPDVVIEKTAHISLFQVRQSLPEKILLSYPRSILKIVTFNYERLA